jgi:thioredoxin reductase (NADPH)
MKPTLLMADDNPQVLQAIEYDLRQKYDNHFRVLKVDSGTSSLELLKLLKLRNEQTALFLVD